MNAHDCLTEFDPECADCVLHDEACGIRCDGPCGERMCSQYGPEPRACITRCTYCPCPCTSCAEAALDREDERRYEMARDERWGA